jgi:hypothetical protein
MSWQEEFHPEVGYLLPSRKVRRLIRSAVLWAGFGILVCVSGTLALLAPRSESPNLDRPSSSAYGIAEAPPTPAEPEASIAAVNSPPAIRGDIFPAVAATRFRFNGRRAECPSLSVAIKEGACTFHRNRRTDLAAVPNPDVSPVINGIPTPGADDATQRPKKPQSTAVRQSRRQKPALERSDNPQVYPIPGVRYGERPYSDRGGFW